MKKAPKIISLFGGTNIIFTVSRFLATVDL